MKKKTTRRQYTEEFREDAVKLVTEQGYKISEAARNLGINDNMLRRWIKKHTDSAVSAASIDQPLSDDRKRIRELEKEVKQLKMEREILKKATAFFVKESN